MTRSETSSVGETLYARRTRARILTAAERRFRHFGYAKTTMVDIAGDCAMSHANVYRFFRSKTDLVDAIAARWLAKSEKVLGEVARRPLPAPERLIDFVLELHRWKKREYVRDSRAHELLTVAIYDGRPFIGVHLAVLHGILVKIIADGVAAGELDVRDPERFARVIADATIKYCHPHLVALHIEEPLEEQARDVMHALLAGISSAKRQPAHR